MINFNKNDIFTATVEGLSSDGAGVCRIDGRAVFVKDALPGETHEIKILKAGRTAVFAKSEKRLSSSPDRVDPNCPHFPKCGGCTLRHVSYEAELEAKRQHVDDVYRRIGHLDLQVNPIIGSDKTEHYRNKAIYAMGSGGFGFYRPRSHEIIPIRRCALVPEQADTAAFAVYSFIQKNGVPAYDEKSEKGLIRHVFTRVAFATGQMQVTIVSFGGLGATTKLLVDAILEALPDVTSIVLNINKTKGNTVLSGELYTLYGSDTIEDKLCGLTFRLSPRSFFQINPPQAEKLYNIAVGLACEDNPDLVLDLYCGVGTISLCLAQKAKHVIGAEIVPEAIENAKENAALNNITNADFICADAGEIAQKLLVQGARPDVIVVDPPRKGLSGDVITAIAQMEPRKIIYISCDSATQARDMALLTALSYHPAHSTPLDLFPRTSHVETACVLEKK